MATIYTKPTPGHAWGETANNPADIIVLDDATVSIGWPLTGIPPSRQRFNFLINWLWVAVRYFMQRGLVDYDPEEQYSIGARVIGDDNNTYASLQNANTGNTPSTSPTFWAPWALTLTQINSSLLTQANVATGDTSTKVANTNFVAAAITQFGAAVAASIAAAVASLMAIRESGTVNIPARFYGHSEQFHYSFPMASAHPLTSVLIHSLQSDLGLDFNYFAWHDGNNVHVRVLNSSFTFNQSNAAAILNYRVVD